MSRKEMDGLHLSTNEELYEGYCVVKLYSIGEIWLD